MRPVFLNPTWAAAVLGGLEVLFSLSLYAAGHLSAPMRLLLIGGGAAMLLGTLRPGGRLLRAAAFALGALPPALLAAGSARAGDWPGGLAYGLLAGAVAVLAAPGRAPQRAAPGRAPQLAAPGRAPQRAAPGPGRRVAEAALVLAVAATGALLLPPPPGVAPADTATVRVLLGTLGLAAASGFMVLSWGFGRTDRMWRVPDPRGLAMLPLLVLYGLSDAASQWYGLGLAAWAVAVASAPAASTPPAATAVEPADADGLRAMEQLLESWSWVVALGASAAMALDGHSAVTLAGAVPVYILGVTLYHTTVNWRLPQAGTMHCRILANLCFATLTLGLLGVSGGYVGHAMRALLAVVPITAWSFLGARRGRQMTGLVLAVFLASTAGHWALSEEGPAEMPEEILLGLVILAGSALASMGRVVQLNRDSAQLRARLSHLESHDALTGLPSRRQFQAELEARLAAARAGGTRWALLLVDVDGLRDINDTAGHAAGDEVLRNVARALCEAVPEPFLAARTDGDEFSLLTRVSDTEEAQVMARRMLGALRRDQVAFRGLPLDITASIGIAVFPEHGPTARDLLAHADSALQAAKAQGAGTCEVYADTRSAHATIGARLAWDRRVRDAVEQERFVLHAQPILDLRTGSVAGYELLLRLADPDRQLVMPGAFLDVAERLGLMPAIDRWVVRQAIRLLAAPGGPADHLFLAVNLSPRALASKELLSDIERELTATGANPARLVLEITEETSVADLRQTRAFIAALQARGCRFALDDFAAGFSSMHHLRDLPIDVLKIDGRFITSLAQDPVRQHMVRALVEMAHGLGKEVVAEFVDGPGTMELLRQYRVEQAQGYYIGHPIPVTELSQASTG